MKKQFILLPLSLALASAFQPAWAQEEKNDESVVTLSTVNATQEQTAGKTETVSQAKIQKEMIKDNRDLVRYSTNLGVSETLRHNKGFAINGVEENRVGLSIDGVALPNSEDNSLYSRYGNFNTSRQTIDPELMNSIDIVRGADSFNYGSGSLGGGVNYRTLNPSDIITDDKKWGLMIRSGYATRNREQTHTIAAAYVGDVVDALLAYSYRHGHEMESTGKLHEGKKPYSSFDPLRGTTRQLVDKSKHYYNNFLGKLGIQINPHHRVGVVVHGQRGRRWTDEWSYTGGFNQWREPTDSQPRTNINLHYQYTPDSTWLALARLDYDYMRSQAITQSHLGSWRYNFLTNTYLGKNAPTEYKDYRLTNTMKRITFRAETHPLNFLGADHQLSFSAFIGDKEFDNKEYIRYNLFGRVSESRKVFMEPIHSRQGGVALKDSIVVNDIFSGHAGIRYDYESFTPQEAPKGYSCDPCTKYPLSRNDFKGWSYSLGIAIQPTENWRLSYDFDTGFRIPSASEQYFRFLHPAGSWAPNTDLQAERSRSHTIALQGSGSVGDFNFSYNHTKYKDFLFEVERYNGRWDPGYDPKLPDGFFQQMANLDSARIKTFNVGFGLNLNALHQRLDGFRFSTQFGYSRGKLAPSQGNTKAESLLSIQPWKFVVGLDYEDPEERWGIFTRYTYITDKKAKDTFVNSFRRNGWSGYISGIHPYPFLSKKIELVDVFGYYKPSKNLTIRAGVYNLLDRRYVTWDALRGAGAHITSGTTSKVDANGYGIQRLYAPGRNYSVSLEYKF